MKKIVSDENKTMWDHSVEFYAEHGVKMPPKGSREATEAYEAWATWAFSNLSGKSNKAEKSARRLLDQKITEMRQKITE